MERSVVATTVGGPPEFVTPEAGVLVDPLDADDLAAALERAAALPSPNAAGAPGCERARRRPPGRPDGERARAGGRGRSVAEAPLDRCHERQHPLDLRPGSASRHLSAPRRAEGGEARPRGEAPVRAPRPRGSNGQARAARRGFSIVSTGAAHQLLVGDLVPARGLDGIPRREHLLVAGDVLPRADLLERRRAELPPSRDQHEAPLRFPLSGPRPSNRSGGGR